MANSSMRGKLRTQPRARRWPAEELSRPAGWAMAMIVGLALLVSSCGPAQSKSTKPSLVVSPSTGLAGGQQLRVSVRGFPANATVELFECGHSPSTTSAGGTSGCVGTPESVLHTGNNGRATGSFVALSTTNLSPVCRNQCLSVAVVTEGGARVFGKHGATATAPLSFSPTPASSLADSFLQDLSWVSTTDGWALAGQPCTTGTCARLAHTTDGGSEWQMLPEPPAQVSGYSGCPASVSEATCVGSVAFATSSIGYLYGPSLLLTTDGGQSWQTEPGLQVETLTVADGAVYRVAYTQTGCPGPCQPTLQEAPFGSDAWQTLIGVLATPDRSDSAQIVSSDSALLVAMYGSQAGPMSAQADLYRSTDAGGSWQEEHDPCSGQGPAGVEEDLIDLAGAPGGFFAGLCGPHTGTGSFVVTSTDGGSSWQKAGPLPAVQVLNQLAAASSSNLAVSTGSTSGAGPFKAQLFVSTDGGENWSKVASDNQQITPLGIPAWLGFETTEVGRWIGDPHSVWTTNDGGAQWSQSPFG